MKKILIVSDTHGIGDLMAQVIKKERPIDMLIHCGDLCVNPSMLECMVNCTVHAVRGNCDHSADLSRMKVFRIGKLKVVLTHGHDYHVSDDLMPLTYLAKENEADIVMYGHTHKPLVTTEYGITIVNPGSLTLPRQENHVPSYIIMNVDDNGDATFDIKYWGRD